MNTTDTALAIELQKENLPEQDALALQGSFAPFFREAERLKDQALSIVVVSADQKDVIASAREMRLNLKAIRTSTENARKNLKDESLRRGRAIDGMANVIKFIIVPLEEHLEAQEKFAEVQRQKEIEKVKQVRVAELAQYDVDASLYSNLGEMQNDMYANLLTGAKHAYDLKFEAQKKAEQDRKKNEEAEMKERERIRIENEELREKAAVQELARKEEQKKREIAESALRRQRELREEEERERKAEEQKKERAAKKLAAAPDKKKLESVAIFIDSIALPIVESEDAKTVVKSVESLLKKVSNFIRSQSEGL